MNTAILSLAVSLLIVMPVAGSQAAEGQDDKSLGAPPAASSAPKAQIPPMPQMGIAPGTQWPNPWQGFGTSPNQGYWQYQVPGYWPGQSRQDSSGDDRGCGRMSGMGGMGGMSGMSGMSGMGGMGGMVPGGMLSPGYYPQYPAPPPTTSQTLGMNMGQGTTIQDLVQLVTLQDIFQTLLEFTSIQERLLAGSKTPEAEKLARELQLVKDKVKDLMKENRAQIAGGSRNE